MRYFVCLLFLLLLLEMAVEARKRKVKLDMCRYMFVNPRIAHKQCNAACWKNKNCWGYCDEEHGRKRCVCGDCERVCPPPPSRQPATSSAAPTEQPATSPPIPTEQSATSGTIGVILKPPAIVFHTNQTYVETQDEFLDFAKHIKEELQQMMKRYNIAYDVKVLDDVHVVVIVELSHVDCDLVHTVEKEFKDKVSLITSAEAYCEEDY